MTRILVIEDEPLIAMLLVDWLRELGYDPIGPASTVAKALDLIVGSAPDAAIVDVSLNGESCHPVAEALRERDIPFVFATGHAEVSTLRRHADLAQTIRFPSSQRGVSGPPYRLTGTEVARCFMSGD